MLLPQPTPGEIPTTGRGIGHTPPVALNEDQVVQESPEKRGLSVVQCCW